MDALSLLLDLRSFQGSSGVAEIKPKKAVPDSFVSLGSQKPPQILWLMGYCFFSCLQFGPIMANQSGRNSSQRATRVMSCFCYYFRYIKSRERTSTEP